MTQKLRMNILLIKRNKIVLNSLFSNNKFKKKNINSDTTFVFDYIYNFVYGLFSHLASDATNHKLEPKQNVIAKLSTSYDEKRNFVQKQKTRFNYFYYFYEKDQTFFCNNIILAFVILFLLFLVLIFLEEHDSFLNLTIVSFLLQITFTLLLFILSHNFANNLLHKNYFL